MRASVLQVAITLSLVACGSGEDHDGASAESETTDPLEERGGFAELPPFVPDDRASLCRAPLLIGHRGSRIHAPENTLPAFLDAMERGGDGVEIDVRRTVDGVLVAMHDERTGATTDDTMNRRVADLTLDELRELDAGAWFGRQWQGTRVPTLDEIVDALPEDAQLVFDLKPGSELGIADFVEDRALQSRSVIAGFNYERLAAVRARLPEVSIAFFATSLGQLEQAEALAAEYVRVPIETQEQETTHWAVIDAGFAPIASSTYLTWNLGMVMVNDMANGVARRSARRPAECP